MAEWAAANALAGVRLIVHVAAAGVTAVAIAADRRVSMRSAWN